LIHNKKAIYIYFHVSDFLVQKFEVIERYI
jgi:hypothetical protein